MFVEWLAGMQYRHRWKGMEFYCDALMKDDFRSTLVSGEVNGLMGIGPFVHDDSGC